jgi:PAS domain S-box-containing protein
MNRVPTFPADVEATLRLMLDSVGEGVLVADEHGCPLFWNSTAERILGVESLRAQHGACLDATGVFAADGVTQLAPDDRPLLRAVRGEVVTNQELVLRSEQGELTTVSCTARALRDATQRIVGSFAVFRVIDGQRRAEVALRESRLFCRALANQLQSAVVLMYDRNLQIKLAEGRGLVGAGLAPEQLEGRPLAEAATSALLQNYVEVFEGKSTLTETLRNGRPYRVQLVPVRDEHGYIFAGLLLAEDLTERRQLEEERDGFFMMSPDMLCVTGADGRFTQLNPAWESSLGWSVGELKAMPRWHLVHPEDRLATTEEGTRVSAGKATRKFENRYRGKDGNYRVLQWQAVHLPTSATTFATARDVTQLRGTQEALKASLAEKEVLLKEIHHRVKNNLQVISSLLKLHGEQVADPAARAAFEDSQDRVRSIALLHEKLYQSKNLGSVSAADYAESLVQTLMRTHGRLASASVSIDAPGVFLPVDLAVPCGLILNELVTNSLKYAFVHGAQPAPEIRIAMATDDQHLVLVVNDNGVGLPGNFDLAKSQTLGMQLVRTLARQLRAKVTMTSQDGTHWTFRFPRRP